MKRQKPSALADVTRQVREAGPDGRHRDFEPLPSVCDAIVALLGERCECLLHDFSDLEHSIVYVSGNVTGRSVGGPLTDLGLQVLTSGRTDENVLVYHSKAPDGTLMKSVSVLLRRKPGTEAIGALCINLDVEHLQRAREVLNDLVTMPRGSRLEEHYPATPQEAMEVMVDKVLVEQGWVRSGLTRAQRLELVRMLDDQGAFGLRTSVAALSRILEVSRYTLYKDLRHIRGAARPLATV